MRFVPVLWPAMLYLDRHRPVDLRHNMLLLDLPCASGQIHVIALLTPAMGRGFGDIGTGEFS